MPKVSIVMSLYNNCQFLQEAVQSILRQTLKDFEFIIIDDGSLDNSLEIIKRFSKKDKRIKIIIHKKKLGLTRSLNEGIHLAKGEFIARMDGDDICLSQRLEKQIEFLEKNQDIGFCGTAAILIDKNNNKIGKKIHPAENKDIHKAVLSYCPFIHPTLMFRRQILEEAGLYNEAFVFAQDYELVLRLLRKYKAANLKEPLLYYRVGEEKSTSIAKLKYQEYLALKARWLALTKYHYSILESWKFIKPLLSFLVPTSFKILIYKKFYWHL